MCRHTALARSTRTLSPLKSKSPLRQGNLSQGIALGDVATALAIEDSYPVYAFMKSTDVVVTADVSADDVAVIGTIDC